LPPLTLVLGGAASGKSAFAEQLCFQTHKPRVYVATAQAFDDEMRAKISDHKIQRGADWTTTERPLDEDVARLSAALTTCPASVVVVSNEVGAGIVPDNKLARQFRNAQGRLNQTLAAQADLVVQVIAGLPQVLKGTLS